MIKADSTNKMHVVDILAESFNDNKSVNYIIKQDKKRGQRLRQLMSYSFEVCNRSGKVFLTEDKKGCALILFPDKKNFGIQSLWLDLTLIVTSMGLANILKASNREATIKKLQPKGLLYYVWFIGVYSENQHSGIGSALLNELISDESCEHRTMCLETSTLSNISWYESFGFKVYNELDLGYRLYFLKRE